MDVEIAGGGGMGFVGPAVDSADHEPVVPSMGAPGRSGCHRRWCLDPLDMGIVGVVFPVERRGRWGPLDAGNFFVVEKRREGGK